ncbi:hypothetical protein PPYR_08927 [Photinus pyralis]|uniref:Centrosomin N-terminal motif 1 domain-containing protein n=1 Tax=Photinus pyralis TaxID=7054 RepID=A0A1Y1LIS0_PHOPY|nr:centrosomin isoform X2 [Photinus pyralis]KAB0797934.1 hypothetical protein PPYR_08927 [Photinus pyralis]
MAERNASKSTTFNETEPVSPSQLQEVTLDPDATNLSRDFSCFAPKSPSDLTSGRTVKEIDEQLSSLKKENFNLKLRLYFIEERMGSNLNVDNEDVIQKNIELQFELANVQKELESKQELLCQAAKVMEIEDEEHKKEISEKNRELCCLKERIEEMRFQLEKDEKDNTREELWTEAFNLDAQRTTSPEMIKKLQATIIDLQNELKQTREEADQLRSIADNAQTKWKHLELQIAPVDALKEELSKKSSIIDSLRRSSTQKNSELHDVKLQLKDIQNLYDSLIVRSEVDQSPSKSNNECGPLNATGQLIPEEVTELKKNHFKACKIIKTMIHKKKDYVDQIEKLQKMVQEGADEIQSLKKKICDMTNNTQFESNKKSIKDKVSELNLTAGWHPSSSIEEKAITEDHADLTTQYKILVDELEKKIEVLHATLQHKDSHIGLLNLEIQEKANSIIDLEFELLAQVEGINENESNDEKQDMSKEKLLEEKDEVIQKLEGELRKRTGDLQGIVNKELWEKNRTIEKLQTIIKGKEEALSKIEKTNNNTELQLKILKQRINELGIHINIPLELASSDEIEYHKEKDHHLLLQLEKSEKMRRDCQEMCCILNNRLEELCHFLQSLLQHKSILGFLGHQQTQRLHEAINKSLELSQTLSSSILIDVDQSLQQLCNITNLLNSTRTDSVIHSFEDDNSVLSIVPSDVTLTYHNHLTSINNERDLVIVLREQIANLQQMESRDSKLDKLKPETSQSLRMQQLDNQSESESWSEPDRSVSLARIGLQGDSLKCGNISSTNKTPSKRTTLVENKQTIMLLQEQILELEMKLTKSEERLNNVQLAYNELEKSLGYEQDKLLDISKQYEISQCDVENLKAQLSKLLLQIQNTNSELEKTKVEKFHAEQQLSQLKVTIESLEELKRTVHLSYDTKTKHMQNMLNEMEIEKTKAAQKAEDLEIKLLETAKHLEQTEAKLQHTQCKLENCQQRYSNELNNLNCKLQQQTIALKNLYDKEAIVGNELQQTQKDNIKLTNHAEQLQIANRDSRSKILSLEEKIDHLLKQLDDVTLKNSELVLEKAKLKNESVILESKIVEASERNLFASQICISNLERKNLLLESQLKNVNKGRILKYTLSSSLPSNLNLYKRQISDHSDYTLEEIQGDSEDYRSLSVHNDLEIVDDNDRLQASSSPDLGIESDQGRLSSLENNAGVQRPLLPSLRIAQTVNNLLNSVENNICKSQSCNEQMERISNENVTLRKRLLRTKRTLDETLTRLTLANKQKKEVEKSICKQIHKTSQVLRKAKANLDSGSEN